MVLPSKALNPAIGWLMINFDNTTTPIHTQADIRSQLLELKQSQQKGISVSASAATVAAATLPLPVVTTVLAYTSKSDAQNISCWSSSDITQFDTFCLYHRIYQLTTTEAW